MSDALILGIDPGIGTTGYALVRGGGTRRELVRFGVALTTPGTPGPRRLADLHRQLMQLVAEAGPEAVAVEQLFFAGNTTTAMQVAEARGVILLAMEQAGLPVWEYTPAQVKSSITGYGKATKQQVMRMVKATVEVTEKMPDDAFDAVAIALCHLQSQRLLPQRQLS